LEKQFKNNVSFSISYVKKYQIIGFKASLTNKSQTKEMERGILCKFYTFFPIESSF